MTGLDDSSVVKGGCTKVLEAAAEEEQQTVSEILSRLPFSQQYVSQSLQRLENDGLVKSRESSEDRRNRIYRVTEEGWDFLDVVNGIYAEA
ncbi:MarR family winged helix-turn-helix transcriptional regulator [Natrinema sp. H-ect4]|uniref:MarR family winged helix-turn-helix transcriptional regulator n=1 Tax=Natrinema sp. H-ect4 TaxID=3242699 RepID=UPI0035A8EDB3